MQNATFLLKQGDESSLVFRIIAVVVVDQRASTPECTGRACRHSPEFGVLLHDQKSFKDGSRRLVEHVFMHYIQELVDRLETPVDWRWRVRRRREDRGADVLQQNGIELGDGLCCAVILLHQLFARQAGGGVDKTEFFGDGSLMVEKQTVFASARGCASGYASVAETIHDAPDHVLLPA